MPCRFSPEAIPLDSTAVDNIFLLEYMPHASGLQLQAYLLGLLQCRYPAYRDTPLHELLGVSAEELLNAFAYWQQEGLLHICSAEPLEIEYLPTIQHMRAPSLIPGKYHSLVQAVQSLLAPRMFRSMELRRLYDWVEVFALEEDAVLELVSYCLHRKGPHVHIKYMDAVAKAWSEAGVRTAQDAKAHALAFEASAGGAKAILKRWRIHRAPTQDESDLYEKWTGEWGFHANAIQAACPALTSAEHPSFAYLDGVLGRLKKDGIVLEEDILLHFAANDEGAALAQQLYHRMGIARSASLKRRKEYKAYLDEGMPLDVMLYAAEHASQAERPLYAFQALLEQYKARHIVSVEAAAACAQAQKESPPAVSRKKNAFLDHPQQSYSEEELQHIFINLDEEV